MHAHPPSSPSAPEAVVIHDLHKRFGSLEVLKGVSLTAYEGDVLTLIGSSGSGKSTLLRCVNMLEVPDSGRIVIGGEEIRLKAKGGRTVPADPKQVDRVRTQLGMVFQSFNLWSHMTILQNVIEAPVHVLGVPKAEAVERARMLLDKVGILAKADSYPVELSGGQQQRAAIARALWEAGPESFMANGEAYGPGADRQPVLLSADPAPLNGASHVILADGTFRETEGFARVFLLFPPALAPAARQAWRAVDGREGLERAYFAQEDGRWVKKG